MSLDVFLHYFILLMVILTGVMIVIPCRSYKKRTDKWIYGPHDIMNFNRKEKKQLLTGVILFILTLLFAFRFT